MFEYLRRSFLSLLLLSFSMGSWAKICYAHFNQFSSAKGLVSNCVRGVDVDSHGFIWAATDFGLDRFDGQRFRHFSQQSHPDMARNDVLHVHCTRRHILIGGYNGLVQQYDAVRDAFTDAKPLEFDRSFYKSIDGFYRAPNGREFLLTIGGLYVWDARTERYIPNTATLKNYRYQTIYSLCIDRYGQYWLGTVKGFQLAGTDGEPLSPYLEQSGIIPCIKPLDNHRMVVATQGNRLCVFAQQKGPAKQLYDIPLPFNNLTDMLLNPRGRSWFATDGHGLWFSDNLAEDHPTFHSMRPYGVSDADFLKLYSLAYDHEGNLWIGSQDGGLYEWLRHQHRSITFSTDMGFPPMVCSSFAEDAAGHLLVGTDGKGLFCYTPRTGSIRTINLPNNNILSVVPYAGNIGLSTWGQGIMWLDAGLSQPESEIFKGIPSPIANIFNLATADGELWAGTAGDGLYYKPVNAPWRRVLLQDLSKNIGPNQWIKEIICGPKGERWILTSNTLWQRKAGRFISRTNDLSIQRNNNPLTMNDALILADGSLLTATNKGILWFSAASTNSGRLPWLPVADYHSLVQMADSSIFAAGSNGIIHFNISRKSWNKLPGDYSDKQKFVFYPKAKFITRNGTVLLGCNGGFISIQPSLLTPPASLSYLSFASLAINRQPIAPFTDVLQKGPLSALATLTLSHTQTDLAISLDVLDFDPQDAATLRYRLKGLNNEWQPVPEDRILLFSHLPAGTFWLQVQGCRSEQWSQAKTISLKIEVLPPWWAAWWFRTLVIILLGSGLAWGIQRRFTQLKRNKAELEQAVANRTRQLADALDEKDRLIGVVAHDLRNPMFGIVSALENLNHLTVSPALAQQLSSALLSSAQRLQTQMQSLLAWARSDREQLLPLPQNCDAAAVASLIYQQLEGVARVKNIKVTLAFTLQHFVVADERMLQVVIRNLLSNALKFTPADGQVFLEGKEREGIALIEVRDSGVGISAEKLDTLRTQGIHTSTTGTQGEEGTGMGLNLCFVYADRNKGKLTVQSQEGEGTTFSLQLSLSSELLPTSSTSATVPAATPPSELPGNGLPINLPLLKENSVLVVDDDELIRQSLVTMLSPYLTVFSAADGRQAQEIAISQLPDVVVTDVEMPYINGLELSRILAKNELTAHIPVLFISARTEMDIKLQGYRTGAIDYICKPFSLQELLFKISSILQLHQKQQAYLLKQLLQQGKVTSDSNVSPCEPDAFCQKFMDFVAANYSNSNLSVENLAQYMAASTSTLNRKLKGALNTSPADFLNRYRLNRAQQLLAQNELSITDVAYQVGYNDPSYFSRKYKEQFGYPPSKKKN